MSNFRRRLMGVQQHGGLPAGYQEVEYIESTGTQWINTNYIVQSNDQFEITYQVTDINVPNIFSATGLGGNDMRFHTWKSSASGCLVVGLGKGFNNRVTLNTNKSVITIDASANTNPTLNGTSLPYNSTSPYTTFEANELNTPLYLFRANINLGKTRIYSVNIKDKMNLISCLDNTGTPCMYDTVSKQTFYNQGTGEFSYPIDEKYNRVEYIESTGTQYIDLGRTVSDSNKAYVDYSWSSTQYGAIFGAQANQRGFTINVANQASSRFGTYTYEAYPDTRYKKDVNTKYNITYSKDGFYQDGTLLATPTYNEFQTTINAYLFKANGAASVGNLKVYNFKLYEDNDLKMDLVPCYRKFDGEIGMYDTVNKVFYTNAGSGEFLYE